MGTPEQNSGQQLQVQTEVVPFPKVQLRNPFVVKVGQVITGAGVGCGIGIGIGKPINIGAFGQFLPLGEVNRIAGQSGRHVQNLMKKLGLKGRLDAGIGCGVGVGHGFVLIGIGLKPGVPEQLLQFAQDTFRALASRYGPQLGPGLALIENKISIPGVTAANSSVTTGDASQLAEAPNAGLNPFTTKSLSSLSSSSPVGGSGVSTLLFPNSAPSNAPRGQENEVERLKLEKDILQRLLRQQKQIEDLHEEINILRGEERPKLTTRSSSKAISSSQECDKTKECFECRRKARRRT